MPATYFCPNCSAKLRGMHVLERHFAQKIACRHNAHLARRRRRSISPIASQHTLARGTMTGRTEASSSSDSSELPPQHEQTA